jgi:hypothetical protein
MASPRMRLKIEQICRMRIDGIKDVVIAERMHLSNSGLQRIIRTTQYQELEESVLKGQVSKMDEQLAGKVEEMRQEWRSLVPIAKRTLLDCILQKRDLRTALAAAKEVFNRDPDGTFLEKTDPRNQIANNGMSDQLANAISKESNTVSKSINDAPASKLVI